MSWVEHTTASGVHVVPRIVHAVDNGRASESDMQTNCDGLALLPHPAKNLFITVQTYTGSSYQLVIV
jgi:hypothetical protein